jgi:hypothetical protein
MLLRRYFRPSVYCRSPVACFLVAVCCLLSSVCCLLNTSALLVHATCLVFFFLFPFCCLLYVSVCNSLLSILPTFTNAGTSNSCLAITLSQIAEQDDLACDFILDKYPKDLRASGTAFLTIAPDYLFIYFCSPSRFPCALHSSR